MQQLAMDGMINNLCLKKKSFHVQINSRQPGSFEFEFKGNKIKNKDLYVTERRKNNTNKLRLKVTEATPHIHTSI